MIEEEEEQRTQAPQGIEEGERGQPSRGMGKWGSE